METFKLNYKSLLIGLGIFIALKSIVVFLGYTSSLLASYGIHHLLVSIVVIFAGYITGSFAKQGGIIHAGIVAIIAILIMTWPIASVVGVSLDGPMTFLSLAYHTFLREGFLCSLAGLLGQYHINTKRIF